MQDKNDKSKVYDALGGDVLEEAKQFPIEQLKLLTTENTGKLSYNRCTETSAAYWIVIRSSRTASVSTSGRTSTRSGTASDGARWTIRTS